MRAMHRIPSSSEIANKQAFEITGNGVTKLSDTLVNLQRTPKHKLFVPTPPPYLSNSSSCSSPILKQTPILVPGMKRIA
jgi:hypothetical protein